MLAVELLGRAVGRGVGHQVVPPEIAARLHVDRLIAGAADDDHFSTVGDFSRAASTFCLSGTILPAPPAAVGGDDELGLGVVVAVGDGVGAEAAEDDRMRRADAGAGQHGDGQLGDHRHVDGDAVARLDAELLEDVGELADLAMQVLVASGRGCRPARLPR